MRSLFLWVSIGIDACYGDEWLMNLSGTGSPHWESSPSSAEISFGRFLLFNQSLSV